MENEDSEVGKIIEIKPKLFVQKTRYGNWIYIKPLKKDINKPFTLGNIHWKNLLIGDWITMLIVLLLLFTAIAYKHDVKVCTELQNKVSYDTCYSDCWNNCDSDSMIFSKESGYDKGQVFAPPSD